ncbi:MAG: DUF6445 family protein [Sphingomonadales bacterium]|jgi:hypothetical protein
MQISTMVIDDFLDDPLELRRMALTCDYPVVSEQTYFPGRNAQQQIPVTGLEGQISQILHEELDPIPGSSHSKCRIALEGDVGKDSVHIDRSHWTGILCLSKDEDCKGGTDLYRHLPTGTDHAPMNSEQLRAMGMTSFNQIWDELLPQDTNDPSKWELITHIPMKFNRLIMIRPWQWHDAGKGFGNSLENGRLVYLLSLQNKQSNNMGANPTG